MGGLVADKPVLCAASSTSNMGRVSWGELCSSVRFPNAYRFLKGREMKREEKMGLR